MFRVPDSVVTRRPITLLGVIVPAGTTLSKTQIESLGRNFNALIDGGYVVATPDPFARKGRAVPRPSSLPPVIRAGLLAKSPARHPLSVGAKVAGKAVSVEVEGGVSPFTVTVGSDVQVKKTRTFAFTVNSVGTHEVSVSDGGGGVASASFTIIVMEPDKKPVKKAGE